MKRIQILGIYYDIELTSDNDRADSFMGTSDEKAQRIKICNNMSQENREETVIHEILHIIDDRLGIGLKENQIRALSVGLKNLIVKIL